MVTNWLYNNFFGGNQLAQQGQQLDSQLQSLDNADYAPGGRIYNQIQQTQGTPAADAAYQKVQADLSSSTYAADVANADGASSPGIGSLISDLVVLSLIGGAIWLFLQLGGAAEVKKLAGRGKHYFWGIVAVLAVLAWVIYSRLKKTQADATSTATGIWAGIKALNPFA